MTGVQTCALPISTRRVRGGTPLPEGDNPRTDRGMGIRLYPATASRRRVSYKRETKCCSFFPVSYLSAWRYLLYGRYFSAPRGNATKKRERFTPVPLTLSVGLKRPASRCFVLCAVTLLLLRYRRTDARSATPGRLSLRLASVTILLYKPLQLPLHHRRPPRKCRPCQPSPRPRHGRRVAASFS